MNPAVALFWAVVLCAVLVMLSLVDAAAAAVFAVAVLAAGTGLSSAYGTSRWLARRAGRTLLPAADQAPLTEDADGARRRTSPWNRSDMTVGFSILLVAAPPVLEGIAVRGRLALPWIPHPMRLAAVLVLAGMIAAAIYVATLVDWYCILPRISGLVCPPPCRSSADRGWITVSRAWLTNRWLSIVFGGIVCGAGLIGSGVYYLTGLPGSVAEKDQLTISFGTFGTALLVAGISVGLRFNLLDCLNDMLNPTRAVGKLVRYQSALHYVVDVSLQGVKINPVMGAGRYGGEPFPADKGQLVDPRSVVVDPRPFLGCSRSCSGVNFYCDNNWRKDRYK